MFFKPLIKSESIKSFGCWCIMGAIYWCNVILFKVEYRAVQATASLSPPQSLLFQDNTLSFASQPLQKLNPKGLSMGDSCHTNGMPREVREAARQLYPAFSVEASVSVWPFLSQPGPIPNSGPGSWSPTSWAAGLHTQFVEQPRICCPYS